MPFNFFYKSKNRVMNEKIETRKNSAFLRDVIIFICLPICLAACEEKPKEKPYTQTGQASYYARMFEGRKTASGTTYRKDSLTAAHKFLPLGTAVKVTNLANEKEVTVEVNDRGPYIEGRIIDLSREAAKKLGMMETGTADVSLEVVKPAPGYSISDSSIVQKDSLPEAQVIN